MKPAAPRPDVYAAAHQALRLRMADVLARLGRLDVTDEGELRQALGPLDDLLNACRLQAAAARVLLHPAIEARCPGTTLQAESAHREHRFEIEALRAEAAALAASPDAAAARRLARHVALFVGRKLVQMEQEETLHNAALWAACGDPELVRLRDDVQAAIDPPAAGVTPAPAPCFPSLHAPGA